MCSHLVDKAIGIYRVSGFIPVDLQVDYREYYLLRHGVHTIYTDTDITAVRDAGLYRGFFSRNMRILIQDAKNAGK